MTLTGKYRLAILFSAVATLLLGGALLFLSSAGTPAAQAQDGSAPAQPTGLAADASHDSVELTWDDPSDDSITHYQVLRRDRDVHDTGEFVTIEENTGSNATSYTDNSVEPEKRYVYRVKAVNQHGASKWSKFARANTPAAPQPRPEPTPEPDENTPATGQPTMSGTAQVGETLTAVTSGISDADGLTNVSFSYQWIANDGSAGADISGATGSTYTPVDVDVGKTIRVRVSFIDDASNPESLTSAATAAAVAKKPNSPATGEPTISGTPQVGGTLTADTSSIEDVDGLDNVAYSYQWIANDGSADADISGATDSTYTLVDADEGKSIKVRASFTDDRDFEESLTSAATAAVAQKPNSPATGQPTISGTVQVGETLTANTSGIDDADGLDNVAYSYQWTRNDGSADADISGATGSTYTPVDVDVGKTIKVRVSFTDDASNPESLTSAATAAVAAKPSSPATGQPTISGTAQVGETLTGDTSGIADADGLDNVAYSYQWTRNDGSADADISGATDSTYTLVDADVGKTVKVRVSFTDDANNPESLTSTATAPVAPAADETEPPGPIWSATLTVGRVGDSYGYQSFLNPQAGSLVPATFVLEGVTYTVGHIETAVDYLTAFGVDRELPVGFTLELDGARFESSDASLTSTTYSHLYTWPGRGSDLKVGEEVTALVVASPAFVVLAGPDLAPSNLQARGSDEKVTLTWTAPAEDAGSVTGYEVLRAQGKAELTTLEADTGSTDTTYTDGTATESGETYAYQVKALRGEEKSQGSNRAEAFIPATTLVEPEPPVAALQSGLTEVPFNWSLVPSGLGVGAKFRLLFVSSTTRNAESTDIAAYNTWVQNRAAAGHTDIQSYSSTFTAVGSTAAVDARDNTHTTYTSSDKGVPIYWLNGNKVVDDYEDFYDGGWDNEANRKTEAGTASSDTQIWTGSYHNGTERFSGSSSRALGQSLVTVGYPDSSTAGNGPLSGADSFGKSVTYPLYGLSGVFTVAAPPPTEVPFNWSLVPSGLGVGDEFRLLFMSSTTRNASPTSISTYNTWIQNRAAEGHTDIQGYSSTFTAVGSTADVDARDNTGTTGTGVPIFWLNGNKVADQYEDFYDGDWDEEANRKDEDGNASSLIQVWTGSDDDGTEAFSGTTSFALGQEFVALGTLNHASLGPVGNSAANGGKNGSRPVYGLSAVFRVVPVVVPADWSLIPSGLSKGDKFRLLFLSSTKRSIRSTNISDYNTFVQNRAAAGHTDIQDHSDTFRVLVSTAAVAARDNTGTTYTSSNKGVRIYWLNGDKAADQYEDFYDGSWDQQADAWNESGDEYDLTARRLVATGSSKNGTTDPDNPLGASSGEVQMGCLYETSQTNGPVSCNFVTEDIPGDDNQQLYGLSGVFQVHPNNPATGKPVITGTPAVNQTLTADISGIMDADGLPAADQFAYQWIRSDGTDDSDISGATDSTYRLENADLGKTIKVRVTFTDALDNEEGPLTSDATRPVTEVGDATGAPAITGTAQVGELLTAGTSNIADPDGIANATFSYQWIAYDGSTDSDIDGATGETYRPLLAHLGQTVKVRVTFTDDDDNAESLTSPATAAVTASTYGQVIWAATLTVEEAAGGAFGFSIDGRGSLESDTFTHDEESFRVLLLLYLEGSALSVRFDNALGTEDFSLYLDDAPFLIESPGANTSFTFSDHGLTWTDGQEVEVRLTVNTSATGAPVITGTPEVNQTLTADTSGIMDADGLPAADQFAYQWIRSDGTDDSDISGATDSTYRLENADQGKTIKVRVTFTDEAGYEETLTSDATGTVTLLSVKVLPTWSLVPDGLGVGDKFRLLFISSEHRNASPSNIATYNTWIQDRAANGHTDIQDYSDTFRAVGSTEDMDARDNTGTTYTSSDKGIAIYWLNGAKAADEYEDFYDEDWDEEASMRNESGTEESGVSAWTGSDHDGTEALNFNDGSSRALGNSGNNWVRFGKTDSDLHGPLSGQTANRSGNRRIYGLSGVFEVAAPPATKVPSNWSLIPSGLGVGDEFRLLFISSTTRNASPSNIDTYNTWIQDRAAAGHTDIQRYSDTFRVVGSTAAVDARDNTGTTGTGVPIYWLNGNKVADDYEDFYDGGWDEEATMRTEAGTSRAAPNNVLTGSDNDGTAQNPLGNEGAVNLGQPNSSEDGEGPLCCGLAINGPNLRYPLYGLSGVFRVAKFPATGKPVISGTPQVNQTLTADISGIMDADGLPADDQFSYQWVRNDGATDSDISGATNATYKLKAADLGKTIKVRVTFTDEGGNEEELTSDATKAVAADITGPVVESANVTQNGERIDLLFDESLETDAASSPPTSAFAVTADGAPVAVGAVLVTSITKGSVFLRQLTPVIYQGQSVTVTYTDPTSGNDEAAIQDEAGNDAASFTTGDDDVPAATNDSTVEPPTVTLVSNADRTIESAVSSTIQAQSFVTGPSTGGYTLSTVQFRLGDDSTLPGVSDLIAAVKADDGSGGPDALVANLANPASLTNDAFNTFAAPTGTVLAPDTTYWVVVNEERSNDADRVNLGITAQDEEDEAFPGWSIGNNRLSKVSASDSWGHAATVSNLIVVSGKVIVGTPEITEPALESANVTQNGERIDLLFDESLETDAASSPPTSAFAVTADGAPVAVGAVLVTSITKGSVFLRQLTPVIYQGQSVTVTYTDPTSGNDEAAIQDEAGNDAYSFTTGEDGVPAVTNNSTVALPVTGTLVSNIGQTASSATANVTASQSQGQGFTTGANPGGYTLGSVELDVSSFSGTASHITVSIYSESSGDPGTLVHTLTTPASISPAVTTFTAPSGATLAASTTYYVVIATTDSAISFSRTSSMAEDAGGASGWSIADDRRFGQSGSWNDASAPIRIRINGPAATATDATLSGLVLNDGTNDLTLTPAFVSGTLSYAASVGNAVSQVTVTPETNDSNASVEYLDGSDAEIADADGTATGQQVDLVVGANTIKVKVTAADATTTETYTVVVTRTTTTSPMKPGQTRSLNVSFLGNGQFSINWDSPLDDGGSAITGYKVQWKSGSQSFGDPSREHTAGASARFYTITGLTNGTEYTVRVIAVNAVGDGPPSDTQKATPGSWPDAPGNVQASGNAELTVTWDAPNDRGIAITDYTVQLKLSSVSGWPSESVTETTLTGTPPARSHTFTGLTNGTVYTVRVKATNALGDSDWSAEATGTPSSKPPPSVTITTGGGEPIRGPFTFTVTFSEEVEGFECPVPQCEIGASYVGGAFVAVKDFQEVEVNSDGEHIFTARVEDILTGTLVIAVLEGKAQAKAGGLGNAFGAMQVEVERPALPDIPGVHVWSSEMTPADIGGYLGYGSVGDLMGGSLADDNFNWQGQTYTVKALLYNPAQVQLDLDYALPNRGERMILAVDGRWVTGSNPRQFGVIQGGEALLSYHWHPADPGFEAGRSVAVRLSRQLPNVLVTRDYAALSWSDPQDDSITGYRIERRDQDGEFTTLVSDTGSADTGYTDRTVEPGGRYAYRVTAMNDYGESEPSGPVEVDIPGGPPDQPTGLSATAASEAVTLSWDDPQDDSITGYKVQWKSGSEDYDGSGGSARQAEIDDPAGRTHRVTGLTDGVEYRFRVIAVNDDGDGAPSAETTGTPGETTRPELSTVTVADATLTLTYGETLDQASQPATDAFSVAVGGADRTVDGVSVAGRAVTLTLASEVAPEDTVTVSYTEPTDAAAARIRDEAGNGAASFSNRAVVNNTAAPANSPATGAPIISGTAQVDETLTVDTSSIEDADGLDNAGFVYQWLADDADIAGATSDSYTLVEADEGQTIKVQVTFTDDANNDETLTSAATGTVTVAAAPGGAEDDAIWTSTLTVQRWGNSVNRLFGFDGPLGKGKLEPERFSHDGVEHRVEMLFFQKKSGQLHFVTYSNLAAGSYLLNLDGTPFQFEASGTERRFSFSKSGLKWQKGDVVEVSLFSSDEDSE